MSTQADRVVVLDRDGTIVVDRGYLSHPDGLELMPTAGEALRWLWERDYRLIVVTNQSGIGRGMISFDQMEAMNARLHTLVEGVGAKISKIYYCPHVPADKCRCRKPNIGLMQQAAAELNFNPRDAVVVGDRLSDVEFGRRAGARSILISPTPLPWDGADKSPWSGTAPTLLDAARLITA